MKNTYTSIKLRRKKEVRWQTYEKDTKNRKDVFSREVKLLRAFW